MKNNRSSHQKARSGWFPKRTSDKRLAQDIVASIMVNRDHCVEKHVSDYTQRAEIVAMVNEILAK